MDKFQKYHQKQKERGYIKVSVWIPKQDREEFLGIAKEFRDSTYITCMGDLD